MPHDLLLLSSSAVHGMRPFEFAADAFSEIVGDAQAVHFVPFALADNDGYTRAMQERLYGLNVSLVGIHAGGDPRAAVEDAEVLFIGGGNSFRLLAALQRLDLVELIRDRVEDGELRFVGSSAGSNVACPSLRTTNDMPIVQPRSFEALGLVPFQVNPHYVDADPSTTHMGETREKRIREFIEENDVPVLGMREGAYVRRQGGQLTLGGVTGARLFRRGEEPVEYAPGDDLSILLAATPRFDSPG